MKVNINPISDFLTQLRISFLGDNLMHKYDNEKAPIRSELFSLEQLETYARNLAKTHQITTDRTPEQLLKRLAENEEILLEVHNLLTESAKENIRITPAGEWLLDNFYLIEEQVYTGKKHLPKGYSKGLPQLLKGPSAGLPRVYDLAIELIAHSDGRVDLSSLTSYTGAYQEVSELKLGELWAIPIMLRLALIENLRRLAALIAKDRITKNLADYWADQMTQTAEKDPKSLILVIADMARYGPPMESSFVAELTRRLVGKGSAFALPISWIEQRLSELGMTSDELVHIENQKQAADQVSISNSIGSLRFLSTNNWRDFVESISTVEKILLSDTNDIYPLMDFRTRDDYRHMVEKLAKGSTHAESEIARMAVEMAKEGIAEQPEYPRAGHVGYYLIGKGLKKLEKAADVKFTFPEKIERTCRKMPLFLYTTFSFIGALFFAGALIRQEYFNGLYNPWILGIVGFFTLIACSQLSITLINWASTIIVKPLVLPRMNFSHGIPDTYRTLVVVPSLFNDLKELEELIDGLEVRFLANRDPNIHFALLTDFKDSKTETGPGEDELISEARNRIKNLNERYGKEKNEIFFMFHRPRKYNPKDRVWMGYERKRGKLAEMNALLRGRGRENFSLIVGEAERYEKVKYVITLDTDTQLPRDAGWKIAGTMAHPMNHPFYSEKKQRVVEGYGILQPRVAVSLPTEDSTIYARMHENEPGIDPYTRAISDVYQDLFGEGSFIGKGIYDVDAFEKALKGRFPENRILSHDLLEGSYARCGLLSDVQLYEAYPKRYDVDMKRRHRWIRGDWQIASWLWPWVPGGARRIVKNPISGLSKWKIFDNLRRSLVPVALLFMLLYGWIFSGSPMYWTISVLLILILPSFVSFFWEIWKKPEDVHTLPHLMVSLRLTANHFVQQALVLLTLPYEAVLNMDAIVRTNWRVLISHRYQLKWQPSNSLLNRDNETFFRSYLSMWFPSVLSLVVFGWMSYQETEGIEITLPFLIGWLLVPAITWKISLPYKGKSIDLSDEQKKFLYKLSRKTWAFFETFVVSGDNWLPPDNYQENPVERIAHRTSPTNMGLSLLANMAAWDFGYIPTEILLERTSNSLHTMHRMERYQGHFYNWYDTQTLEPMAPKYISTVDSGNLAGHLLTLKQGLLALGEAPVLNSRLFRGLKDTVDVLMEKTENDKLFLPLITDLDVAETKEWKTVLSIRDQLQELAVKAETLLASTDQASEAWWWADKLIRQIREALGDLYETAPWLQQNNFPARFQSLENMLSRIMTLNELAELEESVLPVIHVFTEDEIPEEEKRWLETLRKQVIETERRAKERLLTIQNLLKSCEEFADLKFDFLYDKSQRLLSIGYNVTDHRRDNSYYDLLASESRLTIFVGIAQGKLMQDSWFALGRQLTNPGTSPVLVSWSGSMFEYLMPLLVMPNYDHTLLDQTYRTSVQKQIEYGRKRDVPWGVSESGYNMVDASLNYQYRAFGVPGLGLKRGLGEDLVVAPYAAVMALMVAPEEAAENLLDMEAEGFGGKYGMFEAIDYTASRLTRGQPYAIVRSFMAHHQGMSFLSFAYLLLDKPMQKRFEAEAQFRAVMLLLQERTPNVTEFYSPSVHVSDSSTTSQDVQMRIIKSPGTAIPEVQLLSNGRFHSMISNSGSGYSRWKDISVTRWREDISCDHFGTYCFIRDLDNESVWSAAYQPSLSPAETYEVVFSQGRAEFRRQEQNLETHTEIVVSSEDDVEMRKIRINNRSRKKRYLEVTSYAEVVLAPHAADASHPAFSNLFVQTEILPQRDAILCTRRPRSVNDPQPWMFHLMKVHNAEIKDISYETDRSVFTGRTRSIHEPDALKNTQRLTGTQGAVLDPIVSIRYRFIIEAHDTVTINMVLGVAESRESGMGLIEKYQDRPLTDRAFELAWTHSQVVLRQIDATEADAQLYAKLAGSVIFPNASLRADPSVIIRNRRGQSALWSYSISGDLPIVLLQIQDAANIDLARQLVQAHAYWRLKGLLVDLVIWNEDYGGYRQALQNELISLISPGIISDVRDKPAGIFIRSGEQVSQEDRILFQTVARIIISDTLGTLEEQISRRAKVRPVIPYFTPTKFYASLDSSLEIPKDLSFFNGTGGFSKDGKEYVIITDERNVTPAPWCNIIANPVFGTVVSESGQAYSWMENAHEYRLTPWNNDAVSDLKGEAFYIRDEESGKFWSPSPLPHPGKSHYISRHGFGYSEFHFAEDGIYSEMVVFVDTEEPVKFISFKIKNNAARVRKISITGYMEWVLGEMRSKTQMHITTEVNTETGILLAGNAYHAEFGNYVSFFDVDDPGRTFTCDRIEFLGRNGTYKNPEAMGKAKLSGRAGAGLDACAAIQSVMDLADGEERELVFRLGSGTDSYSALRSAKKLRGSQAAKNALEKVKAFWKKTLSVVEVNSPDPAINYLCNGWLNYQTMASRLWGRSGFYQSGGAFGFRDQLQDVLSLLHNRPDLVRQQIVLSASRQFKEGDVQHWWHPPMGRGVRTACSDDYLWLPYVTARYIRHTGDESILDEQSRFIEGRTLNPGEESYYELPAVSEQSASLYEHCVRSVKHGLRFGEHGLPLMGSGDWNDGMDKVGIEGKGESVWLAFFLYDVLNRFEEVARIKKDPEFASFCKKEARLLSANINSNSWDGAWFRRAYFDDGTPLGSSENDECKIDSIPQSWSVISGAGDPEKSRIAMESAYSRLVKKENEIIQLFDPPFNHSALDPGYIKGYLPGVRENGGQYTHAAIWLIIASAARQNRERAYELIRMINPLNHGTTAEEIKKYKIEPYVIAADVYDVENHKGRGGWTWYTGSAGWMYQLLLESFFGLKRNGNKLSFEPCFPADWPAFTITYQFGDTDYQLTFDQQETWNKTTILVDDAMQDENAVLMVNDRETHQVMIRLPLAMGKTLKLLPEKIEA
ncbi:MAG: GH36-type glycosyl hydrolase domain-containing protein [Chitinophagales bacterium]